jgi:hypothetical protein
MLMEKDNEPTTRQEIEEFLAAGILPFTRSQDGAVMFFLGKELAKGTAGRNKYVWSDFGGKREGRDESGEILPLFVAHMHHASCIMCGLALCPKHPVVFLGGASLLWVCCGVWACLGVQAFVLCAKMCNFLCVCVFDPLAHLTFCAQPMTQPPGSFQRRPLAFGAGWAP